MLYYELPNQNILNNPLYILLYEDNIRNYHILLYNKSFSIKPIINIEKTENINFSKVNADSPLSNQKKEEEIYDKEIDSITSMIKALSIKNKINKNKHKDTF